VRFACLQYRERQEADSYSFSDEFAQFAPKMESAAWSPRGSLLLLILQNQRQV
jgi:hypothetical protein